MRTASLPVRPPSTHGFLTTLVGDGPRRSFGHAGLLGQGAHDVSHSEIHANIPASDLTRARDFYTRCLGSPHGGGRVEPHLPHARGSWFQVYETSSAGTGRHTVAQWDVADIAAGCAT